MAISLLKLGPLMTLKYPTDWVRVPSATPNIHETRLGAGFFYARCLLLCFVFWRTLHAIIWASQASTVRALDNN